MRIRPIVGVLVNGQHLDPSGTYEVEDRVARMLVASGRARMAPAEPPAPTPAEAIETREPVATTREPRVRKRW